MRVPSLNFLPSTVNFSRMTPQEIENLAADQTEANVDKEYIVLAILHVLNTDKERIAFLFELLRQYGYQFDYGSIAHSLHINLRWFMRIKANMKKLIQERFHSHI